MSEFWTNAAACLHWCGSHFCACGHFLLLCFINQNYGMRLQWCVTISCLVASDKTSADVIGGNGAFALALEVLALPLKEPVISLVLSLCWWNSCCNLLHLFTAWDISLLFSHWVLLKEIGLGHCYFLAVHKGEVLREQSCSLNYSPSYLCFSQAVLWKLNYQKSFVFIL